MAGERCWDSGRLGLRKCQHEDLRVNTIGDAYEALARGARSQGQLAS